MANDRPLRRRRGTSNATGDDDSVRNEEQTPPQQPIPDRSGVDLNSRSATHVANIVFLRPQQYNFPVIQFECHDCLATCHYIRDSLQAGPEELRPLVRIEDQKLEALGPHRKGHLHVFANAATLDGNEQRPISVFSLYIPKDLHIRYFWTLMSPANLLTEMTRRALLGPAVEIPYLDKTPARSKAGVVLASRHHILYECMAQNFLKATTFPDSPEYHKASLLSDACPSITDPATAHQRIESENDLHPSHATSTDDGKDLGDDRYILELPAAERALACLVHVCCAEYLLIKRLYFKAFSHETVLHAGKVRRAAARSRFSRSGSAAGSPTHHHNQNQHQHVDQDSGPATPTHAVKADEDEDPEDDGNPPEDTPNSSPNPRTTRSRARSRSVPIALAELEHGHPSRASAAQVGARNRALQVRTRNAHRKAVEAQTGWSFSRAKKLVRGWEILGFLDEESVLGVVEGEYV